MSSERSAFVDGLVDAAGAEPGEFFPTVQQMDLLAEEGGSLKKQREALRASRKRGPGRPAGSKNRHQKDLAKWFIQQFGDPLAVLGEIMTMPVDVLYQQMVLAQGAESSKTQKITGKDAIQLKISAATDALPYVHGKKPITIDRTGNPDAVIIIPGMNAPMAQSGVLADSIEKLGLEHITKDAIISVDGVEVTQDELLALRESGEVDDGR